MYTCLCYFDDAQLEVIPGSHKYNNPGRSIESYSNRKVIYIKGGDILVFHANLHHRGINYNKTKNRRVLQVFEVFPDKETYDENISKLVTVKSSDSFIMKNMVSPLLYILSQQPIIIDTLTMLHYTLMYNDLQYKLVLLDISPDEKKNKYVGYEPGARIMYDDISKQEKLNVNIICDTQSTSISFGNYYLYMLTLFIVLCIIIYLFFKDKYKLKKRKPMSKYNK
jgi:hypothetical protein